MKLVRKGGEKPVAEFSWGERRNQERLANEKARNESVKRIAALVNEAKGNAKRPEYYEGDPRSPIVLAVKEGFDFIKKYRALPSVPGLERDPRFWRISALFKHHLDLENTKTELKECNDLVDKGGLSDQDIHRLWYNTKTHGSAIVGYFYWRDAARQLAESLSGIGQAELKRRPFPGLRFKKAFKPQTVDLDEVARDLKGVLDDPEVHEIVYAAPAQVFRFASEESADAASKTLERLVNDAGKARRANAPIPLPDDSQRDLGEIGQLVHFNPELSSVAKREIVDADKFHAERLSGLNQDYDSLKPEQKKARVILWREEKDRYWRERSALMRKFGRHFEHGIHAAKIRYISVPEFLDLELSQWRPISKLHLNGNGKPAIYRPMGRTAGALAVAGLTALTGFGLYKWWNAPGVKKTGTGIQINVSGLPKVFAGNFLGNYPMKEFYRKAGLKTPGDISAFRDLVLGAKNPAVTQHFLRLSREADRNGDALVSIYRGFHGYGAGGGHVAGFIERLPDKVARRLELLNESESAQDQQKAVDVERALFHLYAQAMTEPDKEGPGDEAFAAKPGGKAVRTKHPTPGNAIKAGCASLVSINDFTPKENADSGRLFSQAEADQLAKSLVSEYRRTWGKPGIKKVRRQGYSPLHNSWYR